MKLSEKSFCQLFGNKKAVIKYVFRETFKSKTDSLDFTTVLTGPLLKELMSIAESEYALNYECECIYGPGEEIDIDLINNVMFVSLPLEAATFADGPDNINKNTDVIGEWDIDISTRKVNFGINIDLL